ncbi:DUF924 family protein [Ideonella sp. BN130291]|uniref:DUF924 family protein n=1 Tax=Ideonella sp. BN130291 TaxID=3112940 RepID=UPI002E25F7D3|nr:DUF924 family protein [Ideonella sp. BN130291]
MSAAAPLAGSEPAGVLEFWFGPPELADTEAVTSRWFRKDAAFDREISDRFGALIERALAGELTDWAWQPGPALARILLLDQFTRNAFRDSARAFAGDPLALAAARQMVALGQDQQLPLLRRVFVYLPFEHAEDLAAQREALRLFDALVAEAPGLAGYADYARRHHEIIERFGRFPHRNALLGRESTPEELEFLRQPGSGF